MTQENQKIIALQNQVDQLRQQLAQAQKLTSLGELMSTTTHEFNNVLMSVINYAKMGLRHKDDATRVKSFEKILAAGQRAARITQCILGMARNRSDNFESTDMKAIVEDALVLLEREMRKYRVAVERDYHSVPPAMANGNQIQQVLLNLLTNARQAMPRGGTVTIRLSYDEKAETVDLMVRDSGQGIPPEKLPHIFDPYFTTKDGPDASGKGGTGLGLSACRDIIEAHNGRVRVQSTIGRGTAFTIKLPVVKAPVPAPGVTLPAGMPTGSSETA